MVPNFWRTILLLKCILIIDISALRGLHIKVPEAVKKGDSVVLSCDYDLEEVALYSIKWYRYDVEFYRYVPMESPPAKVFIVEHINVDIYRSNARNVTLTNVERETSGLFKCEVSADAPLFHTEIRSAHLLVADVPIEYPVIRTGKQKIEVGSKMHANCTAPGSHPRLNVTWFVNGVKVQPTYDIHIEETVTRYTSLPGLESVKSMISLRARNDYFKNGKMRLGCLATMFNLYRKLQEMELSEDVSHQPLIMGPPQRSRGNSLTFHKNETNGFLCFVIITWLALIKF